MSSDKEAKYRLWQAYNLGEEEYAIAYGSYTQQKNRQLSKHKKDTQYTTEEPVTTNKKKRKD